MEKNTLTIGALSLIVGLGLGYLVWGTQSAGVVTGRHAMPGGMMMSQNIDQHFIAQMIPHHEGAIAMARIALERSKRAEIISLANGIIEAQTREINDMTSWYKSWFGSAPPKSVAGMMHMDGMTGDADELARASDAEFDREFLSQMIPHHEMAIMMAGMLKATTDRPEMKTLADNIITSQSREIATMRGWLRIWNNQ